MYLAYFDESGDSGALPASPSRFYVVSCVLIPDHDWADTLNFWVRLRKYLMTKHGIRPRAEIKATDIRRGQGPLAHLRWSPAKRDEFYCNLMKCQAKRPTLTTFAVAINKQTLGPHRDPKDVAWEFALQRVDTFCRKRNELAMLFPDAGHGFYLRKLVRRRRRHQLIPGRYGGTLRIPNERLIEDPNDRPSHDSYLIQLADWNAFAAHRSTYVDPRTGGIAPIWDCLGNARLMDVNRLAGGPPGIKLYP